jgi:hypothetical protein
MRITVRQAGTAAVLGLSGTPSTFPDSTKRIAGFLAEGYRQFLIDVTAVTTHAGRNEPAD